MKKIINKKVFYDLVKNWTTTHVNTQYELGSDRLIAEYNGQKVMFINNPITVAFYASQLNGLSSDGYSYVYNKIHDEREAVKEVI